MLILGVLQEEGMTLQKSEGCWVHSNFSLSNLQVLLIESLLTKDFPHSIVSVWHLMGLTSLSVVEKNKLVTLSSDVNDRTVGSTSCPVQALLVYHLCWLGHSIR